jgi:NAD-dependent SIR2 family protein deacetylase
MHASTERKVMDEGLAETCARARAALEEAEALLITAGAGMGVDSGLPDFRGDSGFWKAYPPFARLGLSFVDLASPRWFERDPELAWGFYGHRLELYRETTPHAGFALLRDFAGRLSKGAFVFTSNVDGQFQKAGFAPERVCEVHGSIHHAQCLDDCGREGPIWPCTDRVSVDPESMRARPPLPRCAACGGLSRPNVLMFGDWSWRAERTAQQEARLADWLGGIERRLVIVELGAGSHVPTVRRFSENLARSTGALHVRINPGEPAGPRGTLSLPVGALEGVRRILPGESAPEA